MPPRERHAGGLWLVPLRVGVEVLVIVSLAVWGFAVGEAGAWRAILTVLAPAVGFGFWALVDFRWLGPRAEPARLVQELAVSGVAAAAAIGAGQTALGWTLAALTVLYHLLVYAAGQRLLHLPEPHRLAEPTR